MELVNQSWECLPWAIASPQAILSRQRVESKESPKVSHWTSWLRVPVLFTTHSRTESGKLIRKVYLVMTCPQVQNQACGRNSTSDHRATIKPLVATVRLMLRWLHSWSRLGWLLGLRSRALATVANVSYIFATSLGQKFVMHYIDTSAGHIRYSLNMCWLG